MGGEWGGGGSSRGVGWGGGGGGGGGGLGGGGGGGVAGGGGGGGGGGVREKQGERVRGKEAQDAHMLLKRRTSTWNKGSLARKAS